MNSSLKEHGLDDFDSEEKWIDPLIWIGFSAAFLAVIGFSLLPLLKRLF